MVGLRPRFTRQQSVEDITFGMQYSLAQVFLLSLVLHIFSVQLQPLSRHLYAVFRTSILLHFLSEGSRRGLLLRFQQRRELTSAAQET